MKIKNWAYFQIRFNIFNNTNPNLDAKILINFFLFVIKEGGTKIQKLFKMKWKFLIYHFLFLQEKKSVSLSIFDLIFKIYLDISISFILLFAKENSQYFTTVVTIMINFKVMRVVPYMVLLVIVVMEINVGIFYSWFTPMLQLVS